MSVFCCFVNSFLSISPPPPHLPDPPPASQPLIKKIVAAELLLCVHPAVASVLDLLSTLYRVFRNLSFAIGIHGICKALEAARRAHCLALSRCHIIIIIMYLNTTSISIITYHICIA